MSACAVQVFPKVSAAAWGCLKEQVKRETGMVPAGDQGRASWDGSPPSDPGGKPPP